MRQRKLPENLCKSDDEIARLANTGIGARHEYPCGFLAPVSLSTLSINGLR